VKDSDGKEGYLKALDFSQAMAAADPARVLQLLTEAYNFERDVLLHCRNKKMSRVVRAIADGKISVPTAIGPQTVQYLIFEKADKDSRAFLKASHAFDLAWILRTLHHAATGLQQMHAGGLSHQDVKPSNVLVFKKEGAKIADLGRASIKGGGSPFDGMPIAGDKSYAPPELLYGDVDPDWNTRRKGCDCFQLGSLLLFFFTGVGATPAILSKMLPTQHWRHWSSSYSAVLTFVRDAFDEVAQEFEKSLPASIRTEVSEIFRQLCDPDPKLRGHPKDRGTLGMAYSLERYVGKFSTLAKRAELRLIS